MFVKKSKFNKMVDKEKFLEYRVKQLEDILCPCEQHEFVIAKTDTEYQHMGGAIPVESCNKRKLICKKCKKVVYDYDGCGNWYKYEVMNNDE